MSRRVVSEDINQLQSYQGQENQTKTGFISQPVENIARPETQPEENSFFKGITQIPKYFKADLDNNTVLAISRYAQEEGFSKIIPQPTDPNYDPFSDIPKDKLEFVDNYKYANTPEEVSKISARIDRELQNRAIFSEAGTGTQLVTSLLSGITDPINFIPIGGSLYKSYKIGKIAQGTLRAATAGLVSQTAAEGILQATQETRSAEESATNIAAATLLSGVLGAAGSLLSKEKFHAGADAVNKDINTEKSDIEIDPQTQEVRSVGAKQAVPYQELYDKYLEENLPTGKQPMTLAEYQNQLESLTPGIGGVGQAIITSINKINPILRTFNSKSVEAKSLLQDLATHNLIVGKNEAGIASQQSVETAIKMWRAGLGESIPENNAAFKAYKMRVEKEGLPNIIKNQADWNVAVSKALRRGDISEIPEVAQAAKSWRTKVLDPLKDAAIAEKLLPKDVKPETAVSYLSRLWNRKAIIAKEPELRQIISDKLARVELPKIEAIRSKELQELANKVTDLEKKQKTNEEASSALIKARDKFAEERYKFEAEFSDKEAYIKEIVDSILSNLKGETRFGAVTNYDFKITERGPLKERTLNFIRDEEVEQFLENDIERIADRYTRIMGTDVELARKFDGDVNLESRLDKVQEEYKLLAERAKTEEERLKIQKEKKQVIDDLTALRDLQRGTYGTPENPDHLIVRGFRVARQLNYASKLGGVVLSSLNDPLNTISIHGFQRFGQGLGHVISNLKGYKLNIKEAKRAGNLLEKVLHTRLATMAEITDPLSVGNSRFERFIDNVARLGTKFNGIGLWTDTMKGFSSVISQQRIIKETQKLVRGDIRKNNRTYLAFLGIDANNAKSIADQLDKFATKEKNLWVANTDKWTNSEAVRLYRNALNQDVDRTIITPTKGDVPLFMHKEIGKTIGQFKSFVFASTQQVLLRSLQQKDAAALNGFISAVSAGMLIYYLKTVAAGKEPSDDPKKWVVEGIDRSGVSGILMEINNMTEKVTRGKIGVNALIGGEIMSRYASRGIVDTLAGPTAGQIKDLATITAAITTGDIKESDVKAFRRMLPYQNVFYLNGLFNELEEGIGNAVEAERK